MSSQIDIFTLVGSRRCILTLVGSRRCILTLVGSRRCILTLDGKRPCLTHHFYKLCEIFQYRFPQFVRAFLDLERLFVNFF